MICSIVGLINETTGVVSSGFVSFDVAGEC